MSYRVLRIVDIETLGGRNGPYSTNDQFEAGLNKLEQDGFSLQGVIPPEKDTDQTRLIFHKPDEDEPGEVWTA